MQRLELDFNELNVSDFNDGDAELFSALFSQRVGIHSSEIYHVFVALENSKSESK